MVWNWIVFVFCQKFISSTSSFFTHPSCKSVTEMSLSILSHTAVACTVHLLYAREHVEAGLLTYAHRWAGLPVVSVIHLYTGDFVIPLELVSWVTLKGHWISWLTAISTTTAIHWYTWVPAGCSHWAWAKTENDEGVEEKEERAIRKIYVTLDDYSYQAKGWISIVYYPKLWHFCYDHFLQVRWSFQVKHADLWLCEMLIIRFLVGLRSIRKNTFRFIEKL